MAERFALIAGAGEIPEILARSAKAEGASFVAVALTEAAIAPLDSLADAVYRLSIGQVGKIIKTIKNEGIEKVIFIGKVKKDLLFEKIRFDLKALKLLASLKNRNDDTIMLAIVDEFAKSGIEVVDQTTYLRQMMPKEGVLTKRKPTKEEWDDISYGMDMAKRSASLDIGQAVVVRDRSIMAVEAIEGTDEAIKRGGRLARKGAVVAKVAKPDQDLRFDVPCIGADTIKSLAENGGKCIVVEKGKTIILDKPETLELADKLNIPIVGH